MAEGMRGRLRLARAERGQVAMEFMCLDELLSDDHRARQVWSYVEGLDLSPLYAGIESVEGRAGRPAIDPAILVSLWLYATLEDVGSARQLERLCQRDLAYRWIAGEPLSSLVRGGAALLGRAAFLLGLFAAHALDL